MTLDNSVTTETSPETPKTIHDLDCLQLYTMVRSQGLLNRKRNLLHYFLDTRKKGKTVRQVNDTLNFVNGCKYRNILYNMTVL